MGLVLPPSPFAARQQRARRLYDRLVLAALLAAWAASWLIIAAVYP